MIHSRCSKWKLIFFNMNKISYLKNGQSFRVTSIKREQQDCYEPNIYGALRKTCWRVKFEVLQNVSPVSGK